MTKRQPRVLKRKPDADDVVASAKAVIRLVVNAPDLQISRAHKKLVISDMLWKITEAPYGKHTTELRTAAALRKSEKLQHEHVFPRAWLVERIIALPDRVDEIVARHAIACTVTEREAKQLNKVKELEGWARYRHLGIRVMRLSTTGQIEEYDLEKAEVDTQFR
ncbi:MAG TPA: hypothetical protein VLS89_21295 [Candidatus Nanopelagicales bacterium]|nr:hypothetical protein [Candidatus Nanopelagicales bacterium]